MADVILKAERRAIPLVDVRLKSVTLRAGGTITRLNLRGDEAACRAAAEIVGLPLPEALRASTREGRSLLWQGPDEFLIHAGDDERIALFASLETSLAKHHYALVDISHRDIGFTLEGREVEALLCSAMMLDLNEQAFPVGMTTRTLFGKAEMTLWRQAPTRFLIETGRSYANYVVDLLREGARGL